MTSALTSPDMLSALDRSNSLIGKRAAANIDRLLQGRGLYVNDIKCHAWRTSPSCDHLTHMRRS